MEQKHVIAYLDQAGHAQSRQNQNHRPKNTVV